MKQNSHHLFDQQFTKLFKNGIETRIIKNILKNERVCGDIYQNRKKHRNKMTLATK